MRCLVVGASGWVGTAVTKSLAARQIPHFPTASSQTLMGSSQLRRQVEDFSPDTLIFLAGVTPDRERSLGPIQYESALAAVSEELQTALSLPSLKRASYLSSGIVEQPDHAAHGLAKAPYQEAKVREEILVEQNASRLDAMIVRLYSLSGPYLRRPQDFAFHDFLCQGARGLIQVLSTQPTLRSYVSVTDLADAIVASMALGETGVRVTGGELIELGDLAKRIGELVFPDAEVQIPGREGVALNYCGDDEAWQAWCSTIGIEPKNLNQQIFQTAEWLSQAPSRTG